MTLCACVHYQIEESASVFSATVYFPMEAILSDKLIGGTYTGATSGTVSLVPGKLGKAVCTGGYGSSIDFGDLRGTCFGYPDLCDQGYTISLWLRRSQIAADAVSQFYISNGGHTSESYGISMSGKNDGTISFRFKTTTRWYVAQLPVPEAAWVHLTLSWHKRVGILVYLDGQYLGGSGLGEESEKAMTIFNIMYIGMPNNGYSHFARACMDEVLFWPEYKAADFVADVFDHYTCKVTDWFPEPSLFQVMTDRVPVAELEPVTGWCADETVYMCKYVSGLEGRNPLQLEDICIGKINI